MWAALLVCMYVQSAWLNTIIEQANWVRAIEDAAIRLNINPGDGVSSRRHNNSSILYAQHDVSFKSLKEVEV